MQILGPHSQRFWFSYSWVGASPLVLITSTPGEDCDMHCQEHVFIFICANFCMLNKNISDCSKLVKDDRQEIFLRTFLESLTLIPCSLHIIFYTYSWPLNNTEVRDANCLHNQKSTYNFWIPQNLITNSLLLTGSLTNNVISQLTHILYTVCIIYCIFQWNKLDQRKHC